MIAGTAQGHKVAQDNGLLHADIMITAGANHNYVNCVMTLLTAGSEDA
jgi:hypothetical protein